MDFVFKAVRQKVSGDKQRFQEGEYDLDFTYITDRLIAMAFPGEGLESTFRNNIDDVAEVLKAKHGSKFLVYNLSEKDYDYAKFHNQVMTWCRFPDHHPPSLALLCRIVRSMHDWMQEDPENVAIIHCKAGHGRTGTVICAYFLYTGLFDTAEDAGIYFGNQRSVNNWGVTGASQIRYMTYYEDMIMRKRIPTGEWKMMTQIILYDIPPFVAAQKLHLEVYRVDEKKEIIFGDQPNVGFGKEEEGGRRLTFIVNIPVISDLLMSFDVRSPLGNDHFCHLVFHPGMVMSDSICFKKHQIDKADKDARVGLNFTISLNFCQLGEEQQVTLNSQQRQAQLPQPWLEKLERDATNCFLSSSDGAEGQKINWARDVCLPHSGLVVKKGGFLYKRSKQDQRIWKRRWLSLRNESISWMPTPRDKEEHTIPMENVVGVELKNLDLGENNLKVKMMPVIHIMTSNGVFLWTSSDEHYLSRWYSSLLHASSSLPQEMGRGQKSIGKLSCHLASIKIEMSLQDLEKIEDETFHVLLSVVHNGQEDTPQLTLPLDLFSHLDYSKQDFNKRKQTAFFIRTPINKDITLPVHNPNSTFLLQLVREVQGNKREVWGKITIPVLALPSTDQSPLAEQWHRMRCSPKIPTQPSTPSHITTTQNHLEEYDYDDDSDEDEEAERIEEMEERKESPDQEGKEKENETKEEGGESEEEEEEEEAGSHEWSNYIIDIKLTTLMIKTTTIEGWKDVAFANTPAEKAEGDDES